MENNKEQEILKKKIRELEYEIKNCHKKTDSIVEKRTSELKLSEEKFSSLFEQAADGILVGIKGGEIVDANESMTKLSGYEKKELIGKNINIFFEKDELANSPLRYDLVKKGETVIRERNIVKKYGILVPIEMNTKILADGRMQALFRDVSKRKEAENAKKESEVKYRNIFQHSPLGIFHYSKEGIITDCNEYFVNIIGSSKERLIGFNMFTEMIDKKLVKSIKQSLQKGESYFEGWYSSVTSHKKIFARIFLNSIKNEKDDIISGVGLVEDITDKKRTEIALTENEKKYRMLYETANDAIFLMDNEIFIDCNEKTLEMFACTREQIIGQPPYQFSPEYQPDGRKSKEKAIEKITDALNGNPKIFEWIHTKNNGMEFYAEVSLTVFELQNKNVILAIVRDVSERKELEQKIFNAVSEAEEKERQRLASDIHDEIGPLLSSLKMYIESINETNDLRKQKYLKEKLQSLIKDSITNVREVSNALSPYLLGKYGLRIAIKSFIENSNEFIEILFETNLQNERFPINIETGFYRIIKELVNNTIKHAKAKSITISLNYKDKKLELIYKDDGLGMRKADLKILEQKGMGLYNITNRIMSIKGNYKLFTDCKSGFKFQLIKEIENLKE
ncbi:MAG: PAS domain S-box protein [Bacteroidales bacterium]|nr:PAS domain S-box protein [Bacteroidales bacterium]